MYTSRLFTGSVQADDEQQQQQHKSEGGLVQHPTNSSRTVLFKCFLVIGNFLSGSSRSSYIHQLDAEEST